MGRFRALRSATTAVGGRHRLLKKAGENFIMVMKVLMCAQKKKTTAECGRFYFILILPF